MTEADIPPGAKVRPLLRFRWKRQPGEAAPVLQQHCQIEDKKTLFYLWRAVPEVDAEEPD